VVGELNSEAPKTGAGQVDSLAGMPTVGVQMHRAVDTQQLVELEKDGRLVDNLDMVVCGGGEMATDANMRLNNVYKCKLFGCIVVQKQK
jgi:hypothetical protein